MRCGFHGSAYDYAANEILNAHTPYTGLRNPTKRHSYGFTIGGPVWIPKIYNGKNKTFWFFTWEANKFGDPNVGGSMISTVPSAEWRNGNLSNLLPLGANYQLYDPNTIAVAIVASSRRCTRTAVDGVEHLGQVRVLVAVRLDARMHRIHRLAAARCHRLIVGVVDARKSRL